MFPRLFTRLFSSSIRYTKDHEWVQAIEGSPRYRIGITNHAQSQLGEIVFVEFPKDLKEYEVGQPVITIESVKTTA